MAQNDGSQQDLGFWKCPKCGSEFPKKAEAAERLKAAKRLEALGATIVDKSRCGECGFVVDTQAIFAGRYDC